MKSITHKYMEQLITPTYRTNPLCSESNYCHERKFISLHQTTFKLTIFGICQVSMQCQIFVKSLSLVSVYILNYSLLNF